MLPNDPKRRKRFPLATGLIDYFPDALDLVAEVSYVGNAQHNPGEVLHDARDKSMDDADALMRHFRQRGGLDDDGVRHSAKVAWRALRILQKEEEAHGAPLARGAVWPRPDYDPASVAFRHGDVALMGSLAVSDACRACGADDAPATAVELADADGVSEYGNPVTPGCAVPTADDKTHRTFDVDLTRTAFFYTTDGVYHAYAQAWKP